MSIIIIIKCNRVLRSKAKRKTVYCRNYNLLDQSRRCKNAISNQWFIKSLS